MSVEHIVSEDGSTYYDMKYNLVSLDTFYDCLLKHDYSRLRGMGDNIDSIVENYIAADLLDLDDYETRKEMVKKVSINDIIQVSKKVQIDTIFLLKGDTNEKD